MNDVDARRIVIVTVASLARLQHRLFVQCFSWRYQKGKPVEKHPRWVVGDLDPLPEWLTGVRENWPLDSVTNALAESMVHLTAALATSDPVDLMLVCRAIQNLGNGSEWLPAARRFAERYKLNLASTPAQQFHAAALSNALLPGRRHIYQSPRPNNV